MYFYLKLTSYTNHILFGFTISCLPCLKWKPERKFVTDLSWFTAEKPA